MRPFAALVALALLLPCAPAASAASAPDSAAKPPRARRISYYYDAMDQSLFRPMARSLDPGTAVRALSGGREAANLDANDQVRLPSTWWQPRLGHRPVSVAQMLRGPGAGTGPQRDGPWRVTGLKTQGVSLGIRIKDSAGQTFQLKFDPPRWPEMASGADVVAGRLFWAAGYNVPDNAIVAFTRADLEVAGGTTYKDHLGRKRPITWEVVDGVLAKAPRQADGSWRAVASRFIAGNPLGEWRYRGRRADDPDDLIPHQNRREVRGLYTIAAWLNHTDGSARNTLDMWVEDGGRSFVRHYLIDFSGCLGSGSIDRQTYASGTEHLVDYGTALSSLATLGLRRFRWENTVDPGLPAVGFFEASAFDPADWRPFLPNPAYDERTERDMRWGAKIVAAFTDEHIRAAVALGRYSDPRASEYIVRTLSERRDKIVARWLRSSPAVATDP